jgi:hypothetical protein
VKIESVDDHRQPTELHIHVRAGGKRLDVGTPAGEHLVALIGPDPEWTAEMVEHDLHVWAFARHLGQGLDLRVIDPSFEGQVVRRQPLQAAAEVRIIHQPRRRDIGRSTDDRRIMRRNLADAAEPATGRSDLPFEHRINIGQPQIGEADDAGANPGLNAASIALLRDRPDELAFADRAHFLGTAGAIARTALDEHGRDDVVPRAHIGQELVEQIAAARVIPEMMVRVDDRQIGLEDFLGPLAEPFGVGQRAGIGTGFDGHGILPRGRLKTAPMTGGAIWKKSTSKSIGRRRPTSSASLSWSLPRQDWRQQ